jgi:hypothetical protein
MQRFSATSAVRVAHCYPLHLRFAPAVAAIAVDDGTALRVDHGRSAQKADRRQWRVIGRVLVEAGLVRAILSLARGKTRRSRSQWPALRVTGHALWQAEPGMHRFLPDRVARRRKGARVEGADRNTANRRIAVALPVQGRAADRAEMKADEVAAIVPSGEFVRWPMRAPYPPARHHL